MPLNVSGKQMSNGALAVAGGLVVGIVDTFLPWHSTTYSSVYVADGGSHDALGYWSGWLFFLAAIIGVVLFGVRTFAPQVSMPALPFTDAVIYLALGVVMLLCALLWLVTGGGYASVYAYLRDLPGYSTGPSVGVFIGILAGAVVSVGGYLVKAEPQPATKPLSSYQSPSSPSSTPPPAMPPPAPPPPVT